MQTKPRVHTCTRVCPPIEAKIMHLGTSGCRQAPTSSPGICVVAHKRQQACATLITKKHTQARTRRHPCTHACRRTLLPCSDNAPTHLSMSNPDTNSRDACTHGRMCALQTAQIMHLNTSGCREALATSPRMRMAAYKHQWARVTPIIENRHSRKHAQLRVHTRMHAHPPTIQHQCCYTSWYEQHQHTC
jgi:hypothetical protein